MQGSILVTGANGFVGSSLCAEMSARKIPVRAAVRSRQSSLSNESRETIISNIDRSTDWSQALEGCTAVVHLAARVHILNDASSDPLADFRRINVEGTLNLAHQAASAGVKRFLFVSSIKVNGEATKPGQPFTADDILAPSDPYGISKMEAEQGLLELSSQTGMEVVIIRPPLVYGPRVKANFAALIGLLSLGVPLPLGAIHNRRSLVALDNLVDLIITCTVHPSAAGQIFLVSDNEDVSTTELLRRIAQAMNRPARLMPIPSAWLKMAAAVMGKQEHIQRLCGWLQVDIEKTRRMLDWSPIVTLDQGLKKTVSQVRK